jgi:hypothetical protein
MCKNIKRLDVAFASTIQLTHNQESKVTTVYGGVLSVILVLTVFVYAVNGSIYVYRGHVSSISSLPVFLETGTSKGLNPVELGFDMRFGLYWEEEISPSIGYWSA